MPPRSEHSPEHSAPPWGGKMLGFMLAHEQFTAPQLLDLGAAAEAAGFDLLATSDHFQPWQANEAHAGEAWVTLGALGQRTQRVWMGPTVTCPILRYDPAVVAQTFASLSTLTPGRIFLGVGSGEALNEQAATGQWPQWPERWERLIESLSIIRQLWSGKDVDHHGKYYSVKARLYDPPPQPIPLLTAANGPKAMRLAGQHGDGLITDPKTWKEHKAQFESGARQAGRNPASLPVLIEHYVVVGDQKDAEAAAQLWRFGPKAFKGYHNIPDPVEIQRRAEAEIPLPKVYGDWPIGTDPEVHAKAAIELFNSGATIVNIHTGQPDQMRVIEFYGREVLPRVRQQLRGVG
jgi:TAT-translocated FGD2 family F420-dependent dehydrogenase